MDTITNLDDFRLALTKADNKTVEGNFRHYHRIAKQRGVSPEDKSAIFGAAILMAECQNELERRGLRVMHVA